jgi:hypothetical protein
MILMMTPQRQRLAVTVVAVLLGVVLVVSLIGPLLS